jgi:hypothetical protein
MPKRRTLSQIQIELKYNERMEKAAQADQRETKRAKKKAVKQEAEAIEEYRYNDDGE